MTSNRPNTLPSHLLLELQKETLSTPRLHYGLPARALFTCLDLVYGKRRTLAKFRMLEVLARVPYQSWEHGGYIAVTRRSGQPNHARQVFSRVQESRDQQDNEQWHLLILEELTRRSCQRETYLKDRLLPEVIAFFYYRFSLLLYLVRPAWSHRLNADFEDHAEHEYMLFVEEHPELEHTPFHSDFANDYGHFASVADLFRQIAHDERMHKEESLTAMSTLRFG